MIKRSCDRCVIPLSPLSIAGKEFRFYLAERVDASPGSDGSYGYDLCKSCQKILYDMIEMTLKKSSSGSFP